jgi:hypothetical protein
VDTWLPAEAEPVYAIVGNPSTHRAPDVLLFSLAHPRWELVFQPTYAAYLNLIEIELSALSTQCLDRRLPDRAALRRDRLHALDRLAGRRNRGSAAAPLPHAGARPARLLARVSAGVTREWTRARTSSPS